MKNFIKIKIYFNNVIETSSLSNFIKFRSFHNTYSIRNNTNLYISKAIGQEFKKSHCIYCLLFYKCYFNSFLRISLGSKLMKIR